MRADQQQLELPLTYPEVDVDGYVDEAKNVRYFGKASQQHNGKWHAIADVGGCLCVVECTLRKKEGHA